MRYAESPASRSAVLADACYGWTVLKLLSHLFRREEQSVYPPIQWMCIISQIHGTAVPRRSACSATKTTSHRGASLRQGKKNPSLLQYCPPIAVRYMMNTSVTLQDTRGPSRQSTLYSTQTMHFRSTHSGHLVLSGGGRYITTPFVVNAMTTREKCTATAPKNV